MHLKTGSTLQGGKYRIIKSLGQGGFGITYLAEQVMMERKVCIKEFFLKEYCNRDSDASTVSLGTENNRSLMEKYQEKFLKEARMIARMDHPNIIHIHDVFAENNTAYYVMDYIEGQCLNDIAKAKGPLPEAEAIGYIYPIGEGLAYVHSKQIMHLDVKPGNIMVRVSDNRPVLIDFGLSKQYSESGEQTSATPAGVSPGYAPLEQYQTGGVSMFSPQTDIYSLGATLYRLLAGKVPPQASEVMNDGLPPLPSTVSESTGNAIEKAMRFRRVDRPSTMDAFLALLQNDASSVSRSTTSPVMESCPHQEDDCTVLFGGASAQSEVIGSQSDNIVDDSKKGDIQVAQMLETVALPGGLFEMGAKSWLLSSSSSPDETPQHKVKLSPFSITKHLVTQNLWESVMGSNPSLNIDPSNPVENVSWDEVQEFIKRLNQKTGDFYRLPTEAEWEYAARGGSDKNYKFAGSSDVNTVAWNADNSGKTTHPVGQKKPNDFGLFDMSGNVWEWCQDGYEKYKNQLESNPCHINENNKVVRGGSCRSEVWKCRVSARASAPHDFKSGFYGFRLVKL